MGPFEMVVLIVFIATAGKVAETLVRQLSRPGSKGDDERIRLLEAELRANDARVAQAEEKVAELSEKLGFVEDLLAQPHRAPQLPTPPTPPTPPTIR